MTVDLQQSSVFLAVSADCHRRNRPGLESFSAFLTTVDIAQSARAVLCCATALLELEHEHQNTFLSSSGHRMNWLSVGRQSHLTSVPPHFSGNPEPFRARSSTTAARRCLLNKRIDGQNEVQNTLSKRFSANSLTQLHCKRYRPKNSSTTDPPLAISSTQGSRLPSYRPVRLEIPSSSPSP